MKIWVMFISWLGGGEYYYEQNFKAFLLYVVYTKSSELLAKVIQLKLQPINVPI